MMGSARSIHVFCDDCGREARRPAIGLNFTVLCTRCAPRNGMDPGEHAPHRPYDEWKWIAANVQAQGRA